MESNHLSKVLEYRNEAVVLRFMETWDLPRAEADDLFEQMKKWLWLCATCEVAAESTSPMAISPSMKLVDEMWHTFILFTRDYHDFCDRYLGRHVHHLPTSRSTYDEQIASYEKDARAHMAGLEGKYERLYSLVYDLLGEETLTKWYSEYTDKYTDASMRKVWRWSFSPYDTRVRQNVRLAVEGE